MNQVDYAIKQQAEDILMQRWTTNYEREMSFDEFKSKLGIIRSKNTPDKAIDTVLEDVNDIINLFV